MGNTDFSLLRFLTQVFLPKRDERFQNLFCQKKKNNFLNLAGWPIQNTTQLSCYVEFSRLPYFIQETLCNLSFAHFCCAQKIPLSKNDWKICSKVEYFFTKFASTFGVRKSVFWKRGKDRFLDCLFPTLIAPRLSCVNEIIVFITFSVKNRQNPAIVFGTCPDGRFKMQPNYRATLNFLDSSILPKKVCVTLVFQAFSVLKRFTFKKTIRKLVQKFNLIFFYEICNQ